MTTPEEPFVWTAEVPYFQFDQQGVVFNMWYLAWCDQAFYSFLQHLGAPYEDLLAAGHDQQVVHAEIDWTSGVRPADDPPEVAVTVTRMGTSSFDLDFEVSVHRDGVACPAARLRLTYVNVVSGTPTRPTHVLRRALEAELSRGDVTAVRP